MGFFNYSSESKLDRTMERYERAVDKFMDTANQTLDVLTTLERNATQLKHASQMINFYRSEEYASILNELKGL